ncbi:MAG: SWIM zinc finger family protein [Gemmatimonadaceae bacterium]|nr:SWIM zinc finger family protein [Gemmatimonadaceae bacterium]
MIQAMNTPVVAVDLDRLERGVQLVCERVGQRRFRVTGGSHEHWVDLGANGARPRCDCGDYTWRDRDCKHILAAMLHEGNHQVIQAIGPLVARLKQHPER